MTLPTGGSRSGCAASCTSGTPIGSNRVARERVAEYGEIIAYHLEQAFHYLEQLGPVGDRGRKLALRAGTELIGVGERASARGDSGAAASAYSRALELVGSEAPGRGLLLVELGLIRFDIGEIEAARLALAEARASGDEVAAARATIAGVGLRLTTAISSSAAELREEVLAAVPVLERAADEFGLARAWRAIGSISLFYLARGADAAIAFDRALSHAARARAPREELLARGLQCTAAARGPMPAPEAIALCEATLSDAGGSLMLEALASESLGLLLGRSGRPDDARTLFATARANRADLGQHLAVAGSAEFTGTLELHVGNLRAAERELRAGCDALERIGATSLLASLLGRLAETLYEQGRADEAEPLVLRGEQLAAPDDIDAQIQWRIVRARLLAHAGDARNGPRDGAGGGRARARDRRARPPGRRVPSPRRRHRGAGPLSRCSRELRAEGVRDARPSWECQLISELDPWRLAEV